MTRKQNKTNLTLATYAAALPVNNFHYIHIFFYFFPNPHLNNHNQNTHAYCS